MYNCRRRKCCSLNNKMCPNSQYETSCSNASNSNIDYDSNCSCGFDDNDNLFPSNPMYAQSYVPFQIMDQTFTPCSRII